VRPGCSAAAGGDRGRRIKTFETTTVALLQPQRWLTGQRVTVVAWRQPAISRLLEDEVEVQLLNAAHLRNVPDRNTDVTDSAWIARLMKHDLARASVVPPPQSGGYAI
jgi:transposase